MKKLMVLVSVVGLLSGCNAVKRLTGQSDGSGGGSNSGVNRIVIEGVTPSSGSVTFAPPLNSSSESLAIVRVRQTVAGSFVELERLPSNDGRTTPFYTWNEFSSTITIYNHAGGSSFNDLHIEYFSTRPAKTHSINQD